LSAAGGAASGSAGEAAETAAISNAQPAPTLEEHEAEKRRLANLKARQELGFGRVYAYGALVAMGIQVLIADGAFYIYGYENDWDIPASAIEVWLAATVVQVIGVVLVIARSLFPSAAGSKAN
jgi:hypothetical protein